jgi:hypothetical protein
LQKSGSKKILNYFEPLFLYLAHYVSERPNSPKKERKLIINSTLGIAGSVPNAATVSPQPQSAQITRVKTMGVIALLLLLTAFIPILGFFGLIASLVLSRKALRVSRENLLPIEAEKPAYWAGIISTLLLILSVLGLVMLIL